MAVLDDKMSDAKKDLQSMTEKKAVAEKDRLKTEDSRAADEKYLTQLTGECDAAADAWATRQKDAAAEQAAIDKACEILGSRVKVLLLQVGSSVRVRRQSLDVAADEAPGSSAKVWQTLINHFRKL